jgi:pimeloyl-ACP methyl ester carboxylesterase
MVAAVAVATALTGCGGAAASRGPASAKPPAPAPTSPSALAAAAPRSYRGTLADGATWLIEVPGNWNGTLALYSHGYVGPGSANPALDVGDGVTRQWMLDHGYALAGSSYATTGWAIEEAIPDQLATLDAFDRVIGQHPRRTIAWGHSLGGMITAGLVQEQPARFAGALPMCGVVGGGVGTWNEGLDTSVATKILLAPNPYPVVNLTNPAAALAAARTVLSSAQQTAQGRARIALAAALTDLPGWFTPGSPEPATTDFAAQELNQYHWITGIDILFATFARADLERRAGGNVSSNVGVDYGAQLQRSVDLPEVEALYRQGGLDLKADIARLNASSRIPPDPAAVAYLRHNITFNGRLGIPVLSMHTTGDGLVVVQQEQAYAEAARGAHDANRLQQVFVHRAGHCAFSSAETITAFQSLLHRIDTNQWSSLVPASLNTATAALGPSYSVGQPPSFITYRPAPFLRPFDQSAPLPAG